MTNTRGEANYVGPFITMVLLFFIVGFLTVVNQQFQAPLQGALLQGAGDIKNTLATLITFSFFLAYPLTGGIGARWVDEHGYKGTLIRALGVLVCGLAIFEISVLLHVYSPSSVAFAGGEVPVAFFVFLVGSYVVGAALTVMQVVVNPYLVACSVKGTSGIQRQMIGGSCNSIGTTIAPFFVGGLIFGGMAVDQIQLNQLIIPFIAFMVVICIVAFTVSKLTLPNIKGTTNEGGEVLEKSIWSFSHLTLGVVGIFFYVGVEVAVGANINMYAKTLPDYAASAATMASLYWGGMLVGRLISSTLSKISPQIQLAVTSCAAMILVVASIALGNPWLLVGVGLFHSVMWSCVFTLAIEKLGKYTSKGSGALMIGVVGGGVFPLLMGMMADAMGGDWTWTWSIVVLGEIYLLYYALVGHKVKQEG